MYAPGCRPAKPQTRTRAPAGLVTQAIFKQKQSASKADKSSKRPQPSQVEYGSSDWYAATRNTRQFRTVKEEIGGAPLLLRWRQCVGAPRLCAHGVVVYLNRPTCRHATEYRRQANLVANNGKERKDL